MSVKIPVYSDQFGYHQIHIWTLAENGMFHRTPQWLMPHLLINFKDLSESRGEVVAPAYDRRRHDWSTATAYNYMGRPSSLFQYLRSEAKNRRIMVLTTATNSGRAVRFTVNELRFKNNVSTAVKALTCRSFMDAIDVFIELENKPEQPAEAVQAPSDLEEEAGISVRHADDEATLNEFQQAILGQWRPLAETGDANAQYTLGYLHEQGEGIERDLAAALQWYRLAAAQDHLPAQTKLGAMYASGNGTPQNDVIAYFWFDRVARSGNPQAAELCRSLANRMTPAQRATTKELIEDWKRRHPAEPVVPASGVAPG